MDLVTTCEQTTGFPAVKQLRSVSKTPIFRWGSNLWRLSTAIVTPWMAPKRKMKSANEPRKVSRRIILLENGPEKGYLPAELKLLILDHLKFPEFKAMRLVSRVWSSLVTPMLFWHVYISPRKLDVEIFSNITYHPILSTYVREIVYDASRFELNISRYDYFDRLCDNILKSFVRKGQDLEWPHDHLVTAVKSGQPQDEIYKKHKYDRFVEEGYCEWQRHSWYEEYSINHGVLNETLCEGVKRMSNMSSFVVTGELWNNHLNETTSLDSAYSGCPSSRKWKALYARPLRDWDNEHMESAFQNAACALRFAQSLTWLQLFIGMFETKSSRGLPALDQQPIPKALLTSAINACTSVKSLTIHLQSRLRDNCREILGILPEMLGRMKCLQELTLSLISIDAIHNYDQIFPRTGEWPQLGFLHIIGLKISGYELVSLIAKKLPKLDWLCLLHIELSNGSWEGVIEGLRRLTHLSTLRLSGEQVDDLRHNHGASFVSTRLDPAYTHAQFRKEIEDYVVLGGRHPCLPPEAASEASLDFWRKMCPLRENGRRITLLDDKIELRSWDH